jgi:hypothetical protein
MQVNNVPSAKPYNPTTFLERGVVVPFTTPSLGGTRARLARRGLELIVHHPAGGRGVYVMPWTAITSFCRPTLHDKVLNTRLAFLENVTPATIRRVARAIAAEGLAGEEAVQATVAAKAVDEDDLRVARHRLLATLIRQVNVVDGSSTATDLDAKARETIAWLAPRLGQQTTWGIGAVGALAEAIAGVGIDPDSENRRIPRLIGMLRETCSDISDWIAMQRSDDRVACARLICSVGEVTLSLAETMLARVRALTDDVVALLRDWAVDPASVRRIASRPEWVLDGWEPICLIWRYACNDSERRAALVEIADYVPILPREVNEWSGYRSELEDSVFENRAITLNQDWRTGATVFDLIARNEHLQAAAL